MDRLETMRVFVKVAQRSGFAAAARDLRMSRASVTKHVAAVESRIGARLLDRTTRSVHLTEAGQIYLERCLECLQAFDEAEAAVGGLAKEPRGLLRVGAPFDFSRQLGPLITAFMKGHPAIALDIRLSNRTLDMVNEGLDAYLRITNSLGADSVARPLAVTRLAIWGSRDYFRRHGRPRVPSDLLNHRFAVFDEPPLLDEAVFERDGHRSPVKLRPYVVTNSGILMSNVVCEGLALAALPSFLLPPDRVASLEPVLLDWSIGQRGVYVVYPHRRFVPSKVRIFVDALRTALGEPDRDPWWPAGTCEPLLTC
jgi:DNA-binding transcriptional LysR family regulator